MNTFKSLSGWRRQSLAELGKLPESIVGLQRAAYVAWLQERWDCSYEDALNIIQVHRDDLEAAGETAVPASPSRVCEEHWISDRICIRTVRVYHTKEHYRTPAIDLFKGIESVWSWHRCPGEISSWAAEPQWHRHRKPDAPTIYAVEVDGRRRDGFLTLGRAKAYAERIAAQLQLAPPTKVVADCA